MKRLYVGSLNSPSGKEIIALGICLLLKDRGFDTGFFKPIGVRPVIRQGKVVDENVEFFKKILGLNVPSEKLCPIVKGFDSLEQTVSGKLRTGKRRIISALNSLGKHDVQVISGAQGISDGAGIGMDMKEFIKQTGSELLLIERWSRNQSIDNLVFARQFFGSTLKGVVLNMVRDKERDEVQKRVLPYLKRKGIKVFGVVPFVPTLIAPTVEELKGLLGGKVLCCEDRLNELVEHYLVGAMDVSEAIKYFKRTPNKAVITGAHRSDIQLAALETSTRCIILTGGLHTNDVIIGKAKLKGVPVISVRHDTFTVVDLIEGFYGRASIAHNEKVEIIRKLTYRHLNTALLLRDLGLKK